MPQNHKLLLRKARASDAHDLWEWRNDPFTRSNSLNSKKISFSKHQQWFAKSLKNGSRKIYIASLEGVKVGMVRTDFPGDKVVEVNINMNPAYRGKGLGKRILKMVSDSIRKKYATWIQKAIIKTSNKASERIFSSAGFTKIHQVDRSGYSIWVRN